MRAILSFLGTSKFMLFVIAGLGAALVVLFLLFQLRGARIEKLEVEKMLLANANKAQEEVIALQKRNAADVDFISTKLDKTLETQGREFNDIRLKISRVAKTTEVACGAGMGVALDELRKRYQGLASPGAATADPKAHAPVSGPPTNLAPRPAR